MNRSYLLIILLTCLAMTFGSPLLQQNMPNLPPESEYVHSKEDRSNKQPEITAEDNDPYRLTNDFKPEPHPQPQTPPFMQWNPYRPEEFLRAARYLSMFGYPNPILVPYPFIVPSDYYYPYQGMEEYDDPMSRANGRRPTTYRNSPIYYVRLPPTPYVFVPGLGYTSQPPTFSPNYPAFSHTPSYPTMPLQYNQYNPVQTLPMQPAISPLINLPLNFLANGKPSSIYQLEQPQFPQYYPPRPTYRPNPYIPQPFVQDSKITHLKRPFLFNGRPEEIYFMPNSYNPLYQSPLPGYY